VNVLVGAGALAGVVAACGGSTSGEPPATASSLAPLATSGAPSETMTSSSLSVGEVAPAGFDTVYVRVTDAAGEVCERCMWLAATGEQRATGLMGVTDLGDQAGMVFEYADPAVRRFWMKDTLLPLSIAFADASGSVVATADMDPCTADPCPNFGPGVPFSLAVEVPQGALDELGLVAGSTVELIGDCPSGSD
jgi:uncharacterized membrane protein (UPF0127 family)